MAHYEDIRIDQGADFAMELHLVEVDGSKKDLSSHSVAAKMKKNYNSTDAADVITFQSIIANPPQNGIVTLELTNTQTDSLNYKKTYVYDVELSFTDSDGNTIIERVIEGKAEITPSVTR
jgi:hypothetical protein